MRRDGRLASLRPRELALLEFLAMHPGRAFSREKLLKHVWRGVSANERVVDVHVYWLRSKIERDTPNTMAASNLAISDPSNVNEPPTSR
ncbi:MAG TPA: winged helix-turn-helix domain-containing protein [Candidatus Limnocylindrales bacterium]